jgi:5-formyltetrahydrofolate cyclo-ligase
MNIKSLKNNFRKMVKQKIIRNKKELDIKICNNIWKFLENKHYSAIHTFLPRNDEPNIWSVINKLQNDGIKLYVPKCNGKHCEYLTNSKLIRSKYDIFEPYNTADITLDENTKIDFIFIPLLAFDLKKNRLGKGGGFYDKFLPNLNENVIKIGISLNEPYESIPVEDHDIKLDLCITPNGIY